MRSSKKRSRSNQNRPRTLGNIINRVFDSSGPEGKVRGTPQQIIEKYQTLARDAQLSNDRVAAENFLQHAEHYTRMLAEAQREQAAEQEARQQQYQQNGGHNGNPNGAQGGNREYRERDYRDRDDRRDRDYRDPGQEDQPMVVEVIDFDQPVQDAGLVETPEARPRDDRFKGQRRDRDQQRDGNRDGNREGGAPREGNRDRRDRRDRDAPRDTDSPKREPAVAAAEPALPSFITGATEAPVVEAPVVEAPVVQAPVAEAPAAEKPRRAPRKAKAPADGKPEAAE